MRDLAPVVAALSPFATVSVSQVMRTPMKDNPMRSLLKPLLRRLTTAVANRSLAVAAATVAVLAGLAAPSAQAATTCAHSVPGLLEVHTSSQGDFAIVSAAGGAIGVRNLAGTITCAGAPASTASIDTILVVDDSDNPTTPATNDGDTYVSIKEPAGFGPGKTGETDGVSEIEFLVDPKAGRDELAMGGGGAQVLVAGNSGVSWSSDSDADVVGMPFDLLALSGGPQPSYLSGQGGHGTGAPLSTASLALYGDLAGDTLIGGDAPIGDSLNGGPGNDTIVGHGGADALEPSAGDDTLQGGTGVDAVDYDDAPVGVRVDLASTQPQDTGEGIDSISGVEDAIGSEHADTLLGDAGANAFDGNDGDDTFEGRGGADDLHGEDGSDTASYAGAPAGVTADLSQTTQPGEGDRYFSMEGLIGSAFADTLTGNLVGNRIDGGSGTDAVAAGAGPDVIQVRDGDGDRVSCGEGVDTAISDRRSLDALDADCEGVDALPEPPGGGGTGGQGPLPTGGDTALSFTLSAARSQRVLRQRGIRMRLSSPDEPSTVTVAAIAVLRRGAHPSRLRTLTASVAAGSTRGVRLALSRRQQRALRAALEAGRRPVFRLTARARDAAGNTLVRTLRVTARR
jgi:Ca2+-binding RTX toxin-like protein